MLLKEMMISEGIDKLIMKRAGGDDIKLLGLKLNDRRYIAVMKPVHDLPTKRPIKQG